MKKLYIVAVVLALAIMACYIPAQTPVAPQKTTATMFIYPTATDQWTATVSQIHVNVREEPGGDAVVGYLESGDEVVISRCIEDKEIGAWCRVLEPNGVDWSQDFGWVFRGCLSDNPDKLGCSAK